MKITVGIPTIAGRSMYLESCIHTCVSQDVEDLEILVSDNSEGDAEDLVRSFNDPRIRYIRPSMYLPMSSHWDFLVSKASGDSISIIGDDDGLMPNSISRVLTLLNEVGNIPISQSLCSYYWNDYVSQSRHNSIVFFDDITGSKKLVDSKEFLLSFAKGKLSYGSGPMVYHGFIPLKLIRKLSKDNVFFKRSAPDIYSSMAIAANTDKYLSVSEVLTLPGQGARGNGASYNRKAGKDGEQFEKEMQKFYPSRYNSRTVAMHSLDTFIEVLEQFPINNIYHEEINYTDHLYKALNSARTLPGLGNLSKEILEILFIAKQNNVLFDLLLRSKKEFVMKVKSKLTQNNKIKNCNNNGALINSSEKIIFGSEIVNIYDASIALDEFINKRRMNGS